MLTSLGGISFGYLISAGLKNPVAAMQLSPIIIMPLMLVGGMYVNNDTMPMWIVAFSYISPLKFAFNNYVSVELSGSPYPMAAKMMEFLDIED